MTTDKLDTHYFQQLSALMDGDLAPDQARFLLRRMQHDTDLRGCLERWQLCGDALRGHGQAPAPAGFADRIAAAIAVEPVLAHAKRASARSRNTLARWGGGALAASVAVIALFMVRQHVPDENPAAAVSIVAGQLPGDLAAPAARSPVVQTAGTLTAASVAVASMPRRQADASRRSATRNQQAARSAAVLRKAPDRAVASAAVPVVHALAGVPAAGQAPRDPFAGSQGNAPAARPWPRAVLPQYSSGSGAFNADYLGGRATQAFYPFEPRLPSSPPVTLPEPASRDR
ncbi:MAG: RseA family anti-sigma factor [Pseudoxanthomonas sp.]